MADTSVLKPDPKAVQEIVQSGGKDVKKCYQCATCSVVCELSHDQKPFPRKEMAWAQWGLKDRLMADPDIWLCHQCNDCSTHCPRGARPGDVLAAARKQSIVHYATPKFLAEWVNDARFFALVAIGAAVLGLTLLVQGPLGLAHHPEGEGMAYANLFSHPTIIILFSTLLGLSSLAIAAGAVRYWKAMKAADGNAAAGGGIVGSVVKAIITVMKHDKFLSCKTGRPRLLSHLGVFYGFAALFIVSGWAVVILYIYNPFGEVYPFPLYDPWKVLANLGCLTLIVGCVLMIRNRLAESDKAGASTTFDWAFVWTLLVVTVTGLLTEVMRLLELQGAGYAIYFIHLIAVFALLVYLPYSKFAHIVYRTTALAYADYSGRNRDEKKA